MRIGSFFKNDTIFILCMALCTIFCISNPCYSMRRNMTDSTMQGRVPGGAMGGLSGGAHGVHWTAERGPKLGDRCYTCHDGRPSRRTVNYEHCIPCHSPGGQFDGVNDPEIGAIYNWGRMSSAVYNTDGTLKAGKEKWCVGCHDEQPALIDEVPAPNIAGITVTGDWQSPYSITDSNIDGAENLIDGDNATGNIAGDGNYIIFDLGQEKEISHIRVYTSTDYVTFWEVLGSNDMDNWTRIVLGQTVLFAEPAWKIGKQQAWNEFRLDKFMPFRYIKLVRLGPWSLGENYLCEVQFKEDLHYGYYNTGHKIGCDQCHDITSMHIDGQARTYEAALDNYNIGYRLRSVETAAGTVPAMEVPRVGCNSEEDLWLTNDFALCFKCHDRTMIFGDAYGEDEMFQDPLKTNFRNDTHMDANGFVTNEHVRHIRGRGYCGTSQDWDSDWDGTPDSPISCTACHNVHGSPTPAMTRHGGLTSAPGTVNTMPMINFKYLNAAGEPDHNLTDVMQSIGGITQFYAPGPGSVEKNSTCNMCHNDNISYRRVPRDIGHSLLTP